MSVAHIAFSKVN